MKMGMPVVLVALLLAGCGDAADLPVSDNAALLSNSAGQAQIAGPAIVGNTAEAQQVSPAPPPADARTVLPETARRPASPVRPVRDEYRAIGTEPFWSVEIGGHLATLERPGKPPARFAVTRADDGRAIRYLGDGFTLTLTPGPCSDGMSDATWSDRAQIAFGEGTLKGCGGVRDDGEVGGNGPT